MKMWGEEWKGVKLTRLYLLLREQFAYPDDPWCTETLKWWNEFCLIYSLSITRSRSFQENVQQPSQDRQRLPRTDAGHTRSIGSGAHGERATREVANISGRLNLSFPGLPKVDSSVFQM